MTSNDEQELRKLENDWLSVYISGDKATYDRVVADDFTGTDESAVKSRIARFCRPRRSQEGLRSTKMCR
jgi:hypothetical protein